MADRQEGHVLYMVYTWVPDDKLEEWNKWHTEVHVPDVASQPQVQGAWKYRVADNSFPGEWQPQYVTVYEFNSISDWEAYRDGPEAARLRKDYADRYGAIGKIARQVIVQAPKTES